MDKRAHSHNNNMANTNVWEAAMVRMRAREEVRRRAEEAKVNEKKRNEDVSSAIKNAMSTISTLKKEKERTKDKRRLDEAKFLYQTGAKINPKDYVSRDARRRLKKREAQEARERAAEEARAAAARAAMYEDDSGYSSSDSLDSSYEEGGGKRQHPPQPHKATKCARVEQAAQPTPTVPPLQRAKKSGRSGGDFLPLAKNIAPVVKDLMEAKLAGRVWPMLSEEYRNAYDQGLEEAYDREGRVGSILQEDEKAILEKFAPRRKGVKNYFDDENAEVGTMLTNLWDDIV